MESAGINEFHRYLVWCNGTRRNWRNSSGVFRGSQYGMGWRCAWFGFRAMNLMISSAMISICLLYTSDAADE